MTELEKLYVAASRVFKDRADMYVSCSLIETPESTHEEAVVIEFLCTSNRAAVIVGNEDIFWCWRVLISKTSNGSWEDYPSVYPDPVDALAIAATMGDRYRLEDEFNSLSDPSDGICE